MTAIADERWDGFCCWRERVQYLEEGLEHRFQTATNIVFGMRKRNPVMYNPLGNERKPFIYQGKRYTRDELIALGLDSAAHDAILTYC